MQNLVHTPHTQEISAIQGGREAGKGEEIGLQSVLNLCWLSEEVEGVFSTSSIGGRACIFSTTQRWLCSQSNFA